jgi:hypothetical protein
VILHLNFEVVALFDPKSELKIMGSTDAILMDTQD